MTNTLRKLILAVSLLGSFATHAADRPSAAVASEHRDTLDAYRTAKVRAYLDGKPNGVLDHLAESVRLMPAYQKTVLGRTDAATYTRAFLKRFTVSAYDRVPIEVADLGQRVMEIGRFTMTVAMKGSAESHTLRGKYMDLWEKSAAGKLELNTAGWNHDELPKIADQLRSRTFRPFTSAAARLPITAGVASSWPRCRNWMSRSLRSTTGRRGRFQRGRRDPAYRSPGGVRRKALDEYMETHAKAFPLFEKLDLRTHKIDDLGEYVIEYASGVVTWKVNEYSGVNLGKGILIWRRANGGGLQKWRSISMYD